MADLKEVCVSTASMRLSPDDNAEQSNEILYGDAVEILAIPNKDWFQVKLARDGYEGFVLSESLRDHGPKTHRINTPLSHVYSAPDFKAPNPMPVYFLSQLSLTDERKNGFVKTDTGGWVFETHVTHLGHKNKNVLETALMFLNAPYLWGGRTINGIDCSGLIQISLHACAIDCPRDTHQQISAIEASMMEPGNIQRGDIVFFKGHVGIMTDQSNILNATARSMDARIEPLADLINFYGDILAVKRLNYSTG